MAAPSNKGQDGEIRVALDIATLNRAVYHAVHNVTVKVDDGTTQIDHVVISKYGIFVVETKNYTGWIFGREREPKWTRSSNGKSDSFQNPIRQNIRHIKSLSTLLGVEEYLFHTVIAFCGSAEFKTPMPAFVLTDGYADFIRSKHIELFSEDEAATLAEKLKSSMLERGEETDRMHLESLRQRHADKMPAGTPLGHRKPSRPEDQPRPSPLPRLSATDHQSGAEPLDWRARSRKSNSDSQRAQLRLVAIVALLVVMLFAANTIFTEVQQFGANMTARHQATAPGQTVAPAITLPPRLATVPVSPEQRDAFEAPETRASDKESAWARWYSPPPECAVLTDQNLVRCGNGHIRARREFERLYALGKVR